MAEIKFTLTGDTTNLDEALNKEIAHIKNLGKNTNATTAEINKAFAKLGADLVKSAGVDKALESIKGQMEAQKKAIDDLMPRWKELDELMTKAANGEGKVSFEQTEEYKKLNTEIEKLNKSYAEYETVLKGAQAESAKVSKSVDAMKSLGEAASAVPGPVGNAVGGLKRLVNAAKAFIATPLGVIVAALVAAFGILKSYLTGTAEGQRKLAKASAVVSTVFEKIKYLAQALGERMVKAFTDPKKAISEMVDTLKTRLQNRLEGFVDQWKALGKIIKSVFHLDWDGVNEGAKEFGEAFVKMGTGRTIEDFKKMGEEIVDFANKTKEAADQAAVLADRELNLREQRSKWQIKEAQLDEKIAEARLKAYDEDATKAEQAKALADAQELIKQKYEQQIKFAKEEYDIVKAKNALSDNTIEDYEKEDELLAQITQLQAQLNSELAGFERRRASLSKSSEAELLSRLQEEKNLELEIGQKRLEMQDESLEKTLELIKLDKQRKQLELQAQEQNWKQNQQGQLTQAQKDYIESMGKLIDKAAVAAGEQAIFEKYADAAAKAFKEQTKFDEEAKLLEGKGVSTTEVRRQQNDAALAYMQSEEQEINPHFEMWVESLMKLTSDQLENMLANAEEELATLANSPDADPKKVIEARARVAALRKELKAANKDISRGADVKKYENLNKVLGDAAKGFEELGQTGNEAFDSIMKDVSEVLTSVQSVVGNIQTLVTSSIEAEKQVAEEGSEAVKTVEKASVILAIIGAVLSIAMKIKSVLGDDSAKRKMQENIEQCEALKAALQDLQRETMLDTSKNNTVFGDNMYANLQQYTQGVKELTESMQENRNVVAGLADNKYIQNSAYWENAFQRVGRDAFFETNGDFYKDAKTELDQVAELLGSYTVVDDNRKKFRKWIEVNLLGDKETTSSIAAKYKRAMGEELDLIGATEEETYRKLKAFSESSFYNDNYDKDLKKNFEEMLKNYEAYFEANGQVQAIYENWFDRMQSALADSIKTGFEQGAGAGKKEFKNAVNEMVSDMFVEQIIGQYTGDIFKTMSQEITDLQMNGASPEELAMKAAEAAEKAASGYDDYLAMYEAFQAKLEEMGYGKADALDGTLSGAIKGASQESIDLLSGYCNAVRIQQVDGINIMRDQLISLSGIERNTMNTNTILTAIRGDLAMQFASDDVRPMGAA